jgi:hypothetical protein
MLKEMLKMKRVFARNERKLEKMKKSTDSTNENEPTIV